MDRTDPRENLKILDLTAGNRAVWCDKKNPLVTFLDVRPEVEPDFVCDTRAIPPEVGDGYTLIVYDPPHLNCGIKSDMGKRYGYFKTKEILDSIEKTAKEAHRVSTPGALMAFKWNTHDIKLSRALAFMDEFWEPLFGQVTKYAKRSTTHWVLLKRRD